MNSYTLSAPSKTFLVGEYVALNGGPTLILNTLPRFELIATTVKPLKTFKNVGIAFNSPAGKYLQKHHKDFAAMQIAFNDPHHGLGGFGASSAQFVLLYLLHQLMRQNIKTKTVKVKISELLSLYKECAWSGQGSAPSGADVVAQCQGSITFYQQNAHLLELLNWHFNDIDFCLIHTGHKMMTHQHLATIQQNNTNDLAVIAKQTYHSLKSNNSQTFVESIQEYRKVLFKQHWIAPHTQEILAMIDKNPEILAAKGCGALGADVILVVFQVAKCSAIATWLKQQGFERFIMGQKCLSHGVDCGQPIQLTF